MDTPLSDTYPYAMGCKPTVAVPSRPQAHTVNRVVPGPDVIEPAYITLDLPIADARKLRALLGSLVKSEPAVSGDEAHLRTLGGFPQRSGLAGLRGPDFTLREVHDTAVLIHSAITRQGF